jgi:hypothetical protein
VARDAVKKPVDAPIGKPSVDTDKPKGASAFIVSPKTAAVTDIGPVQKTWLIKLQSRRRFVVKRRPRTTQMASRFSPEAGDAVIFAADGGSF